MPFPELRNNNRQIMVLEPDSQLADKEAHLTMA